MGLREMYNRVTEGFLSRFVVVNINYDREGAGRASDNLWNNVMPEEEGQEEVEGIIPKAELEMYARMMRTLYLTCESEFNVTNVPSIKRYRLEKQEREVLKAETKKAMLEAWDRVANDVLGSKAKDESASIPPPFLFREEQDVLRIAVADAASRRFAGTEVEPGILQIDRRAMMTGLLHLPLIVQTSVEMHTGANRIRASRSRGPPMTFWPEYEIVYNAGPVGISQEWFDAICREHQVDSERAAKRLTKLLEHGHVERKVDGKIAAAIYRH
jgi:hypothetical protein